MRPSRSESALLVALAGVAVYARLHDAGGATALLSSPLVVALVARVASVVLTYWLGRRVGGPSVGLPAAFFLAVAGPHDSISNVMSIGEWSAIALLLGLLAVFRVQERCAWSDFAEAGLGIGLAGGLAGPGLILAALIWLADGLRPANINRALNCAPTFATRGVLPAGAGLMVGALGGWALHVSKPLDLLGRADPTGPAVDLWTALGASLGSGLLALALAGGAVAILRRSPKGVLLAEAALLLLPALALWPGGTPPTVGVALPLLALLGALALRTTVGSLLSPVLAQARALTLNNHNDLVRALMSGRVLRLLGPALLIVGAVLLTMPLWTALLP